MKATIRTKKALHTMRLPRLHRLVLFGFAGDNSRLTYAALTVSICDISELPLSMLLNIMLPN